MQDIFRRNGYPTSFTDSLIKIILDKWCTYKEFRITAPKEELLVVDFLSSQKELVHNNLQNFTFVK